MRILIIGGGGREDTIARKLIGEGHEVWAAPGNPGIANFGGRCVVLDIKNHQAVADFTESHGIEFTIVGPEAPLADGIVDHFNERDLLIFGPSKRAAEIETSKTFCCQLLEVAGIPVPVTTYYPSFAAMRDAVRDSDGRIVLKKCGLAGGKGAEVVGQKQGLSLALARLSKLSDGQFQSQDMEEGPELSLFVLTDSHDYKILGSAQDYKPLYKGGPNTGGMGGFAPHYLLTLELQEQIENTIVRPTIVALAEAGRPYRGVLYFQLMLTKRGPVVIEINCRFGDPEAELLMPLLDCDLLPLLLATTRDGELAKCEVRLKPGKTVGIVVAASGYPDQHERTLGNKIWGLEKQPLPQTYVYHAGTKLVDGQLVTAAGRVCTVVGYGPDYRTAKTRAQQAEIQIQFAGSYRRIDIADEAIAAEPVLA